ncbi:tRNA-modifying protein YgfZ [Stomatohabitans albus]|uniref:CAF17-like 4Fe-4S cluster assembly/insertion protein YgfZ n=1 Tax=Stomatohabitans albus TaxID=3110766 RepID=UPI00300D7B6E
MPTWARHLRVIQVQGPDAHHLLNLLLTQQLVAFDLPAAREWLWLEAKGAIIAAGTAVLPDPETAWLVVDQELETTVVERLIRFRFSLKADIDVRTDLAVYSDLHAGTAPPGPYPELTHEGHTWIVTYPYGYRDIIAPTQTVAPLPLVEGWDNWRVSAGVPRWGREIIAGTRTQELGLLPTHGHMQKGCYPGQESIAKIYNLGEVRRALCLLETPEPVQVGQIITEQKRPAPITSSNGTHALAMISLNDGKAPETIPLERQSLPVVEVIGAKWAIPGGWRNTSDNTPLH